MTINKMETTTTGSEMLKILLKDLAIKHTVSSLAKDVGISRVGTWKILKKMEKDRLILLSPVGAGKTSAYIISLDWDSPLVEKVLALALAEDAVKNQRWLNTFAELKDRAAFLIIYGSIIHTPKQANDIDILTITANKKRFPEIESTMLKIRKTEIKKIHSHALLDSEFRQELKKPNKAFLEAVKKGIVLFGQDNFIEFMRKMAK